MNNKSGKLGKNAIRQNNRVVKYLGSLTNFGTINGNNII